MAPITIFRRSLNFFLKKNIKYCHRSYIEILLMEEWKKARKCDIVKPCRREQTVFEISRNIYKRDYKKIEEVYQDKEFSSELGVVIGAITDSPELVNQALERKGGRMNMCRALEELEKEGIKKGIKEGIKEGIVNGKILARYEDGMTPEEIAEKMGLPVEQVEKVLEENKVLAMV